MSAGRPTSHILPFKSDSYAGVRIARLCHFQDFGASLSCIRLVFPIFRRKDLLCGAVHCLTRCTPRSTLLFKVYEDLAMPTLKPRVAVTLENQTHEVISRLASLQKRSRGAVIADLLDSIVPALSRTVALLEAAREAPNEVKRGLISVIEGIHEDFVAVSGKSTGDLDEFINRLKSGGDAQGVNPRLVTRGSGIRNTTKPAGGKSPKNRSNPGV